MARPATKTTTMPTFSKRTNVPIKLTNEEFWQLKQMAAEKHVTGVELISDKVRRMLREHFGEKA